MAGDGVCHCVVSCDDEQGPDYVDDDQRAVTEGRRSSTSNGMD